MLMFAQTATSYGDQVQRSYGTFLLAMLGAPTAVIDFPRNRKQMTSVLVAPCASSIITVKLEWLH